jgi:hypothetical protein
MQHGTSAAVAAAAAVTASKKRITRKILADLRGKGAVAETRAIELVFDSRRSQSVAIGLMDANVVKRTSAGSYWLDETAYAAYAKREGAKRIWVLVALLVFVVAVLLWTYLSSAGP